MVKMKGLIDVVDNGVKPMLASIFAHKKLADYYVEVGVPADMKHPVNDQPMNTIGMVVEFGAWVHPFGNKNAKKVQIKKRPVLRPAAEGYQAKNIMKKVDKAMKQGLAPRAVMESVGKQLVKNVQRNIDRLVSPPNTPATKAHKKGPKPLIESKHFRNSISYEVKKG